MNEIFTPSEAPILVLLIWLIGVPLAALWTMLDNDNLPPFFDRANPIIRGVLWPIFVVRFVAAGLANALFRRLNRL